MRRNLELYINGVLADIATDALVLMNYKQTDATAPAAIYNSWSQSVALPRTSKNNAIFDHICRADHVTAVGKFNPLARTPFVIYSDTGERLESGYLKLTNIDELQYSATLYGGLGGFLFGLMYNPDGSKRSLADLIYTSGGDEHEFDFVITREAVRQAWRTIDGLQAHADKWNFINFAPCYNGLPGGDFNSKRAFCPSNCYGVTGNDGDGHTDRNGHVLVDLVNNVDEWAANDLRSYQQRPVVSMKAVIDAICDAANNGGYTVNLDADFFKVANPYYSKLWLTLPKLDGVSIPIETKTGTVVVSDPVQGPAPSYLNHVDEVIVGPWEDGKVRTFDMTCEVQFAADVLGVPSADCIASWKYVQGMLQEYYSYYVVALYQLLAYSDDGVLIGGSKVVGASTRCLDLDYNQAVDIPYTLPQLINAYNNASTVHETFTPAWIPPTGSAYENTIVQGEKLAATWNGLKLQDANGDPVKATLQMDGAVGVSRVVLRTTYLGLINYDGTNSQAQINDLRCLPDGSTTQAIEGLTFRSGTLNYTARTGGTVHSGTEINKAILLGGTQSPADYLLSYLKTFGLYLTYDPATAEVGIVNRANFFNGGSVNLEGKIDRASKRSVPFAIAARWYEWAAPVSGRFADYYRGVYNRDYGMARINTGFEFDGAHNDVLNDCVFKGAAEVLHRNKYFVHVTQNSRAVPAPFLDGGKFTLWDSANEAKQYDITCPDNSATINYVNANYPGYDYTQLPKPEFCDKDNKAVGGEDVLLLFDASNGTSYYNRMTLTDDSGLMISYNEGAPCYLLGQWTIAANKKYTINNDADDSIKLYLPRFRRMMTGGSSPMVATHSLDMAVPSEIDQPEITCAADKAVYSRAWASYVSDKMNVDAKVVTCKVDLRGMQVGQGLLRKFYYFDGCVWVLNAIKNHVVGGDDLTECEFIKVYDKDNYTNGQTY